MSSLWSLATILGPILLIGFIVWAFVRNKQAPDRTVGKAEEKAHANCARSSIRMNTTAGNVNRGRARCGATIAVNRASRSRSG